MECNIQFFVRGSHGNWWTWKVLQNLTVFTDASFALLEVEAVPLPDPTPRGFHFEGKCSPPSGDLPSGALMEIENSETLRQLELWRDEHQFIRAELCWMISILFRMLHVMLCRYPVRHAAHNVTLHWIVPKCLLALLKGKWVKMNFVDQLRTATTSTSSTFWVTKSK